jgi:ClpP class serine protease
MWLLKQEVAEELRRVWKRDDPSTATQRAEFVQRREAEAAAGDPRILQRDGENASINVEGVLTEKPDFWAWLLGGGNTTYRDIRTALAIAGQDPTVKRVTMNIASPGGRVDGLFETLGTLEAFQKPITVRSSLAASAAYAIAAVAGRIEPTNAAAEFGSIGVAVTYLHMEELIDITSTEAPNKRPNPSTDEGKAVIREHLDAIHDLFVDAIARGRSRTTGEKITKANVNETFGRGGVLLAGDAKKRKMIDKAPPAAARGARAEDNITPDAAGDPAQRSTDSPATGGVQPPRKKPMTKEELKSQHPELYAALLEEGQATGVAQERKRVMAHLKLAAATGATKVAHDAIASGASTMDEEVHADYLAAGMNRRDSDARQDDSDKAGKALESAKAAPETEGGSLIDIFAADLPPKKKAS